MIGDFDMKLTQKLTKRYKDASRKTKSAMITEYCQLTQTSRNTASKRFCKQIKNPYPRALPSTTTPNKRGPKKKFRGVHVRIVKKCWELAGNICAQRLHPMLATYIDQLHRQGMLAYYSAKDIAIAKSISVATLKRVIATFPRASNKKHKGNDFIYRQVPIVAHFGKFSDTPGYVEIDYVEHNGGSSSGLFIITGTYTDIFSAWTARAAGLGKNLSSVSGIDIDNHPAPHLPGGPRPATGEAMPADRGAATDVAAGMVARLLDGVGRHFLPFDLLGIGPAHQQVDPLVQRIGAFEQTVEVLDVVAGDRPGDLDRQQVGPVSVEAPDGGNRFHRVHVFSFRAGPKSTLRLEYKKPRFCSGPTRYRFAERQPAESRSCQPSSPSISTPSRCCVTGATCPGRA
jgi:hypothetical protein